MSIAAAVRTTWKLLKLRQLVRHSSTKPLVSINNATFYRTYPIQGTNTTNAIVFKDISYSLSSTEYWAVVSPSSVSRTTFLQVLAGQHVAVPATARTYPYLTDIGSPPQRAIKYVGFDADRGDSVSGTSVRGAYLSARYESRREETDFSLRNYLLGNTQLNALQNTDEANEPAILEDVTAQLSLTELLEMPVANLSNGQTRRARIAKALMSQPELLLLDGPFMGLDPGTVIRISDVLKRLAETNRPRFVISLRPEDRVPEWINRLVVIDDKSNVLSTTDKDTTLADQSPAIRQIINASASAEPQRLSRDGFPAKSPALPAGEALIEMQGVKVSYGDKTVLGGWKQQVDSEEKAGLWWSLRRGQRCGIFGPNGSGKTTMLSLITSDHPQTYSLPIKLFGRSRLPRPGELGITLFDLQRRMGHSSPEVHAFFPKQLSLRRTLESAWADAPLAKPVLDHAAQHRVSAFLQHFAAELKSDTSRQDRYSGGVQDDTDWASNIKFGELSFTNQRLALFLRAIVASPDLIILDEAFSGMDEPVRDKALRFLSQGQQSSAEKGTKTERDIHSESDDQAMTARQTDSGDNFEGLTPQQALLVISHAQEDVPGCIREWICLPEPGEGRTPRTGTLDGPLELNPAEWNDIWAR